MAKEGEQTAPSAGTAVRVDKKTDAALKGGIALVDTTTYAATVESGWSAQDAESVGIDRLAWPYN